jgi:DNA-binding NarL/FixJ family response regulator
MRVLLADDESQIRSALRLILEQLKEVETIDEVSDAESLALRLQTTSPDLLLVDWELPGLQSGVFFSEMCSHTDLKVVVLSGSCPAPQAAALSSGADACVSKCEPPDRLFATLHAMGAD